MGLVDDGVQLLSRSPGGGIELPAPLAPQPDAEAVELSSRFTDICTRISKSASNRLRFFAFMVPVSGNGSLKLALRLPRAVSGEFLSPRRGESRFRLVLGRCMHLMK